MEAIVKSIWIDGSVNFLDIYQPADPKCFGLTIYIRVGPKNIDEVNDFQIFVCTPEFLIQEGSEGFVWGNNRLIVFEYDLSTIKAAIWKCVENASGNNLQEISHNLAQYAALIVPNAKIFEPSTFSTLKEQVK